MVANVTNSLRAESARQREKVLAMLLAKQQAAIRKLVRMAEQKTFPTTLEIARQFSEIKLIKGLLKNHRKALQVSMASNPVERNLRVHPRKARRTA